MPGVEVVGVAEDELALIRLLEAVRVDVVVMVPEPHAAHDLADEVAVIAFVADDAGAAAALRAGARGVLLHTTDRAEIAAAIQAVAAGLSVLPANLLANVLPASIQT